HLTYTFRIRGGLTFHDGQPLTARDVKASYDHIIFPASGVASSRKGAYVAFESVTAPDDRTVVFRLRWPAAAVLALLASPWNFIYSDDRRVRRALTLAIDRYGMASALSKITIVRDVAGVQVPGTEYATPPAELETLAGYGRDIVRSRAEARRLLREAGVGEGFRFTLKNRGIAHPYEPIGVYLIDQWRRVGLDVSQETIEPAAYFSLLRAGDFEVAVDFQCGYLVEPDLDLYKFQSTGVSDANYARYRDPVLDDLYREQSRATDKAAPGGAVRAFERRLVDEEAHYLMTLQWHRIIAQRRQLRGWYITPSHYVNQQLDTV